jgi:hypothetical protein
MVDRAGRAREVGEDVLIVRPTTMALTRAISQRSSLLPRLRTGMGVSREPSARFPPGRLP